MSPHSPRRANIAMKIATSPKMIRYQALYEASVCCRTMYTMVPSPPMIVANAISAVHCTLNTALGCTMSWLMASTAPAAPHPIPATTKTSIRASPTRAPELRAATSSSRMAVSTRPSRPRSSTYTAPRAMTVTASPIQYV